MHYAIKILEQERAVLIAALKAGQQERLADLQQLDKALGWLRLLEANHFEQAKKYRIEPLPLLEGRGGFANYRLAIDNETDDLAFWEEYQKPDGSHLLLSWGDYLIMAK